MIQLQTGPWILPHKRFVFSGGEVQVKLDYDHVANNEDNIDSVTIKAHLTSSDDIFELALLTDALRRKHGSRLPIHARIPYLPYARQDRAMTSGEALSLKVFANIINSLEFESVEIWDAHSDVALALIDNSVNRHPQALLLDLDLDVENMVLVSPDAGALKKVAKVAQLFNMPMVRADKTRSVLDGSITGTVVYSDHIGDQDFLIVDDICDGGRTFIELAKVLRPLTNGGIFLYVTHGIFSQGLDVFDGVIDHIYCRLPFPNVKGNPRNLTAGTL